MAEARREHRVIADPEGDTPPTDREGWSPSGKMARGDGDDGGHARGERRRVEEQGEGGAAGGPRPTRHSPEPSFCAAWREEGPSKIPGLEGGGSGRVGLLREVGGEDERGTGPARDPSGQAPRPQGGKALGQGARDGGGQVEEHAGGSAPGAGPGRSKEKGEKAQGADAEGAAGERGMVLKGAGDKEPVRRGAEGRGSVQGNMMKSTEHNE